MSVLSQRFTAAVLAAMLAAVASVPAQAAERTAEYEAMLSEKAPTLVTIKFLLKIKGGFMGEQESESEATGIMIDPNGLVLCSNTLLGGFSSLFSRFGGGRMSVTPTDIKVLVGDDTEGVEAELLARDTELDLAWIQIKEPSDKGYAHVDFTQSAKPKIGQRALCVKRMGKYFDHVPAVGEGHIAGLAIKPRDLYVPSTNLGGAIGLPVYTAKGQVIGVLVTQMPDPEEMEMNPTAMFGNPLSFRDMFAGLILPAEQIVKATKRARESAKEADEEEPGEQSPPGAAAPEEASPENG